MHRHPFRTSFVPGAPRPDLSQLLTFHAWRSNGELSLAPALAALAIAKSLRRETDPCPADEHGTLLPLGNLSQVLGSLDDGTEILLRHRRMAHRAWVRSVETDDDELAAKAAWMTARRAWSTHVASYTYPNPAVGHSAGGITPEKTQ